MGGTAGIHVGEPHSWSVGETADEETPERLPQPSLASEHRRKDSDNKHGVLVASLPPRLSGKPLSRALGVSSAWALTDAQKQDPCPPMLLLVHAGLHRASTGHCCVCVACFCPSHWGTENFGIPEFTDVLFREGAWLCAPGAAQQRGPAVLQNHVRKLSALLSQIHRDLSSQHLPALTTPCPGPPSTASASTALSPAGAPFGPLRNGFLTQAPCQLSRYLPVLRLTLGSLLHQRKSLPGATVKSWRLGVRTAWVPARALALSMQVTSGETRRLSESGSSSGKWRRRVFSPGAGEMKGASPWKRRRVLQRVPALRRS